MPNNAEKNKNIEAESFVFYKSFYQTFLFLGKQKLEQKENLQIQLIEKICEFCFYGKSGKKHSMIEMLFLNMEPVLKKSKKRYAASIKNGKRGGRPKKKPSAEAIAAAIAKASREKYLKKNGIK